MKKSIKPEKYIWDENDFGNLGWHDNRIYGLWFDHVENKFNLSIDYIYDWDDQLDGYWVTPAKLSFLLVSELEIGLSFKDSADIFIENISREQPRPTPNGLFTEWKYIIETNVGSINFFSTGFQLEFERDPQFSKTQDLARDL